MGWFYLFIAAIFEIGWPVGLKLADLSANKILWIVFAIIAMTLSGYFLFLAQKTIPISTAYVVWTGIGAIGTFVLGITLFHDAVSVAKILGVFLILLGIVTLKL